jgi:dCMP deaminase
MIQAHLDVAERYAKLSKARRLNVGAVVVKDDRIISIGYNGTPPGWDNNCEYEIPLPQQEISPGIVDAVYRYALKTKPEVLHAEENAIGKLARSHESGLGATMFITHAPCAQCAKLILVSGISQVYYRDTYRDDAGIKFLEKGGVRVQQIEKEKTDEKAHRMSQL